MDELLQWSSRKGDHGSKACAGFAWELAWPINWPSQAFSFTSHDNLEGILTSEYLININIMDISICKYSNSNL